jgi:hypothetical protein
MTERMTPAQFNTYISKARKSYKRRATTPYEGGTDPRQVLMAARKIPMKMELGPEDRLSVLLADCLRILSKADILTAVWLHVPNEAKRHEFVAMLLQRQGLISGATDYVFGWPGGSGWIELKVKPNDLTPNQQYFRDWCKLVGVPWAVFICPADTYPARRETVTEVLSTLHRWGAITDLALAVDACKEKLINPILEAAP